MCESGAIDAPAAGVPVHQAAVPAVKAMGLAGPYSDCSKGAK